jgi:hypothetical protein
MQHNNAINDERDGAITAVSHLKDNGLGTEYVL